MVVGSGADLVDVAEEVDGDEVGAASTYDAEEALTFDVGAVAYPYGGDG